MAGPITYVQPDWDLDRQLAEKTFNQLLNEQVPPWESEERERIDKIARERASEALRRLQVQEGDRLAREKIVAAELAEAARQRAEANHRREQVLDNWAARQYRRQAFQMDVWLRFKVWLYGLFGISAFQVIWDHRHD